MKGQVAAPPAKPLPVIVKPIIDELLSSWLERTGRLYGVTTRDVLRHFGIEPPDSLRQMDFAQLPAVQTRLAWGLRTTAARIQRAGHPVSIWRANELVALAVPLSRCPWCDRRWRNDITSRPISRSWYEAWRVACGFCHRPFHLGSEARDQDDHALVPDGLWEDAIEGSKLLERYLLGQPCGWLPPRLIWTLMSAPIHSRDGCRVGFGLIIPEASHPAYGTLHQSSAKTCRTENPFKRLALLAVLHRFNQHPQGWLQVLSKATTQEGRAVMASVLNKLPSSISDALLEESPKYTTLRRELLYACQSIELHQMRLRLAANVRQIREFCRELAATAPQYTSESRG